MTAPLKLFVSAIVGVQPLLASAGEINADFAAPLENQPGIIESGTGAPVVDITTPNASGLSHNKFHTFDVGPEGLILNNSMGLNSVSQIGGQVEANPNLKGGKPARIILNEVTGTDRTLLEGFVEVHGSPADVIIANPNGLTCNGCGFLNTPRVTLSTGAPEFNEDRSLKALIVRGGDIKIDKMGASLDSVSVFDIVSRKISLEGPVMGSGDLNLVAGANRYHYGSGDAEALPSDGNEPEVAIDSTALGGMYAGRISIISNDSGSGVNMQGSMVANAGALSLSADGKLTIAAAQSKGGITARSRSASVRVERLAKTEGAIVLEGLTSIQLAEKAHLYAQRNADLSALSVVIGKGAVAAAGTDGERKLLKNGKLAIAAATLHARDSKLVAGELLSITAGEIDIARARPEETAALRSPGGIVIVANTIHAANSLITTGGNMALANDGQINFDQGVYRASGLLTVQAASLSNRASLYGQAGVGIRTARGSLHNGNTIVSDGVIHLSSAAGIENHGKVESIRKVEVDGATEVKNHENGSIAGGQSARLRADRFVNEGRIGSSDGSLKLQASSGFSNSGAITADADLLLRAGATSGNAGTIWAGQAASIAVAEGGFRNSGTVMGNAVAVRSKTLENEGRIAAVGIDFVTDVTEHITNTGTITAPDVQLHLGGRLDNKGQLSGSDKTEISGRDGGFAGSVVNHADAFINGADELHVASHAINNMGEMGSSSGHLHVESTGGILNRGLLYSAIDSAYLVDSGLANVGGDILAGRDMTIKGYMGARAGFLWNETGTIEATSGNFHIDAERITNKRSRVSVRAKPITTTYSRSPEDKPSRTIAVTVTRESAKADSPAKIRASGNLTLNADAVKNSFSQIAAGQAVTIKAQSVINEGRDLLQTIDTTTIIPRSERYCKTRALGVCFTMGEEGWSETTHDKKVRIVGSIYGSIHAGTELRVNATGYVQNNAVRGNIGGLSPAGGGHVMPEFGASASTVVSKIANPTPLDTSMQNLPGRTAVFKTNTSPDGPFLQTRASFIDADQLLGSDFLLDQISIDQRLPSIRRFGDAYAEYQLIRDQAFETAGKMWPSAPEEHNRLLKESYGNATILAGPLGLTVGEPLTKQQISRLTSDIVWLEKSEVLGNEVLVPRLYPAPASFKGSDIPGAQMKGQNVVHATATLMHNSGAIHAGTDLKLAASSDLINQGGNIFASGEVSLEGGRTVANLSGSVIGGNVNIASDYVTNDTLKTRESYGNGFADHVQGRAQIAARDSLGIHARIGVTSEGGIFSSNDDAYIKAGRAIVLSGLPLARHREDGFVGGHDRSSRVTYEAAQIETGDNARLIAGNGLTLRGAKIEAGGLLGLSADGHVGLLSLQGSNSGEIKIDIDTGMLGTRTSRYQQTSGTDTLGTIVKAGGVAITSGAGDISLEAATIDSAGETALTAEAGCVYLVSTEDKSATQSFWREADLLWWDQRKQGSGETMRRHVEIGGEIRVRAGEGVAAEYVEPDDMQTTVPHLAWLNVLRTDPELAGKVLWRAVENNSAVQDDKQQGLSDAAAMLAALFAALLPDTNAKVPDWLTPTAGMINAAQAAIGSGKGQAVSQPAPDPQNRL